MREIFFISIFQFPDEKKIGMHFSRKNSATGKKNLTQARANFYIKKLLAIDQN